MFLAAQTLDWLEDKLSTESVVMGGVVATIVAINLAVGFLGMGVIVTLQKFF
jgi:hypothetical protein